MLCNLFPAQEPCPTAPASAAGWPVLQCREALDLGERRRERNHSYRLLEFPQVHVGRVIADLA